MAITFLGAGTAPTPVASGNLTVSYPGSLAFADVLVMPCWARDNVSLSLPTGWAKKAEVNNGTGSRLTIAWKRMALGDVDTSVLVTHTAGDVLYGRVFAYRGVVGTGDPFEASTTRANASGSGSGTWGSLDLTTLTNGAYWLHAILSADDSALAAGSGFASNAPAGLTNVLERDDWETTTGLDESGAFYDALKATAGRQTGLSITFNPTAAAVSTEWAGALTPSTIAATGTVRASGGGGVVAAARKGGMATAAATGGGAVAATGRKGGKAMCAVTGGGAVSALGSKCGAGRASVSGGGSASAIGRKAGHGAVAVSGAGFANATGRKIARGTCLVAGGGGVFVAGFKAGVGTVDIGGGGNTTAAGIVRVFRITDLPTTVRVGPSQATVTVGPRAAVVTLELHRSSIAVGPHASEIELGSHTTAALVAPSRRTAIVEKHQGMVRTDG